MVRNRSENNADAGANAEKSQNVQQRDHQPRNRSNHQGYNSRNQYQARQQSVTRNGETQREAGRDAAPQGQGMPAGGQSQPQSVQKGNNFGLRNNEGHSREGMQQRGYYRERNRDADRDLQHKHSGQSYGKYGNAQRNRAEETIDDIKQDIIRLEKEIELEIKEIRSLKFL